MPEDQTDSGDTMKTIAIIDDDIHIGDMLEEILTKEGYSVLRAYSGTEALYLLSNKKMDLVPVSYTHLDVYKRQGPRC